MTFPYSEGNKRYHSWNYALRNEFGGKIFKCRSMEDLTVRIEMGLLPMAVVLFAVYLVRET